MIDIIGYVGGGLLCIQLIPQIIKLHYTRKSRDLSYGFLLSHMLGLFLMTLYGVLDKNKPVYITSGTSLIMINILTFQKIYLEKISESNDEQI
jgi:uncharacterized protein with PQ loop repeat